MATGAFHWHYGDPDDDNLQLHGVNLVIFLVGCSLMLLLTLLCLYIRLLSQYRHDASGVQRALPGLDPETIKKLPERLHEAGEAEQCSICLGDVVPGETVKTLPGCSHEFHPECVDAWLRARPSCPLCRASLQAPAAATEA